MIIILFFAYPLIKLQASHFRVAEYVENDQPQLDSNIYQKRTITKTTLCLFYFGLLNLKQRMITKTTLCCKLSPELILAKVRQHDWCYYVSDKVGIFLLDVYTSGACISAPLIGWIACFQQDFITTLLLPLQFLGHVQYLHFLEIDF